MLVVLCIRPWLLSDHLSELALPIVFSATPPLLQSMVCEPLVREVIRRILAEPRVVIFCEHGHHRSVAAAEIAVQEIKLFRVVRIDITIIHIDANQCTSQQWEDLWNRRI